MADCTKQQHGRGAIRPTYENKNSIRNESESKRKQTMPNKIRNQGIEVHRNDSFGKYGTD